MWSLPFHPVPRRRAGPRWPAGLGLALALAALPAAEVRAQRTWRLTPLLTIDATTVEAIGCQPTAIAVGSGDSVVVSPDGGATWLPATRPDGEWITAMASVAVAFTPRYDLYAATTYGAVFRSSDLGRSWTPLAPLPGQAGALLADARLPGVLFAATVPTASGIFHRSLDGGSTWQPALTAELLNTGLIFDLAVSPCTPYLYVATSQGVFVARDTASSGSFETAGWPPGEAMVLGAGASCRLLASHNSQGVWISSDLRAPGPLAWSPYDTGLDLTPVTALAEASRSGVAPPFVERYAAPAADGVHLAHGGNLPWALVSTGPGPVDARALRATCPQDNTLLAATGTGLWMLTPAVVDDRTFPGGRLAGLSLAPLAPHPAAGEIAAAFFLPEDAAVVATLHDIRGRTVGRLLDEPRPAGDNALRWRPVAGTLPSGVYTLRLRAFVGGEAASRTQRVVWLR